MLKKREHKPFHMDCKVTKRRLCYCKSSANYKEEQKTTQEMAFRLNNYYEGYDSDIEQDMQIKKEIAKDHLMSVH